MVTSPDGGPIEVSSSTDDMQSTSGSSRSSSSLVSSHRPRPAAQPTNNPVVEESAAQENKHCTLVDKATGKLRPPNSREEWEEFLSW